jgi:hypothetical protein
MPDGRKSAGWLPIAKMITNQVPDVVSARRWHAHCLILTLDHAGLRPWEDDIFKLDREFEKMARCKLVRGEWLGRGTRRGADRPHQPDADRWTFAEIDPFAGTATWSDGDTLNDLEISLKDDPEIGLKDDPPSKTRQRAAIRVPQPELNAWLRKHAEAAGGRQLKPALWEACKLEFGDRVNRPGFETAYAKLPTELKRGQGEHT